MVVPSATASRAKHRAEMSPSSSKAKDRFVDWRRLPLSATAEILQEEFAAAGRLDMNEVVLVLPTTRAGHRLMEILVDRTGSRGIRFRPPLITTIGSVPELLYSASKPLASRIQQQLAWTAAFSRVSPAKMEHLMRFAPERDDYSGWQGLANLVARWHRELAANDLDFSDLAEAIVDSGNSRELARWKGFAEVQRHYLDVLHEAGLWDQQTARHVAISRGDCRTDKHIILVGLVDLDVVFRKMVEQIRGRVSVISFGDPEHRDWFDDLGCLRVEPWQHVVLPIRDEELLVAQGTTDMFRMVNRELRKLDGQYAREEISIVLGDVSEMPGLISSLNEAGVTAHDVGGTALGRTRPFILAEQLVHWLSSGTFASLATLARHPDMYDWLVQECGNDDWLTELDLYQNNRLPFFFDASLSHLRFEDTDRDGERLYQNLEKAVRALTDLVAPLAGIAPAGESSPDTEDDGLRPVTQWAEPWRHVILTIFSRAIMDSERNADRRTLVACRALLDGLNELRKCQDLLREPVPAATAIQWVLDRGNSEFVVDPLEPEAMELGGWLDAPWEESKVTLVMKVNEGFVPSPDTSAMFIPDSIRQKLGLDDNRRRYARDAWSIGMVLHSREVKRLMVLRANDDGDPLLPGRLLFTGTAQALAGRTLRLFGPGETLPRMKKSAMSGRPVKQQLVIPQPFPDHQSINSMRVTDFKVYLQCPYRYYLSRVLRLEPLADDAEELDAAQFGSLLHHIVENFGRSDARNSADAAEIEEWTVKYLDRVSLARYGREPVPAVTVQIAQARLRLQAFAAWQAEHRASGYQIFEVEREKTSCKIDLDGVPFELRGQIDRIDIDHDRRVIGVYDYKTGEKADSPRNYHQDKQGNWLDLQLPLYEFILGVFDLPKNYQVEFGLICLARETGRTTLQLADWTRDELDAAHEAAREVMRKVRQGMFWPPSSDIDTWHEAYNGICQTNVLQPWSPGETDVIAARPYSRSDEETTSSAIPHRKKTGGGKRK
jgi:ATP-dependent helicase/nuclease subunit B